MKKQDFVYTELRGYKNIIYENITDHKILKHLMKILSDDSLALKIQYCHYKFLPAIIYITCEFEHKEFYSHYRI
jgi:hypothetical protein